MDQVGNVLLRGSDKVAVLIDEKQSSLTGFGIEQKLMQEDFQVIYQNYYESQVARLGFTHSF